MELKSDIQLKGDVWKNAIDKLSNIFATRTNYEVFMLALSIGIMYDKRCDDLEITDTASNPSVPRNIVSNNDHGKMDFMFNAAILSTSTEMLTEDERLELAFGDGNDFKKVAFLTSFANFGVTKVIELIGDTDLETMDNIKCFIACSIDGTNIDLNEVRDEDYF